MTNILRTLAPALACLLLAGISFLIASPYYQQILTLVVIWAIVGLSWNILSGYTGLISFGHAAFIGLGAYTVAIGFYGYDLTPWLTIPLAGVLGGIAGLIIGYPSFRLKGHYFALAMLAYPLALLYVFEWLGYQEVALPLKRESPAFYMQFADQRAYTLIALVFLLAVMYLTRAIEASRFGRALIAIKQNEPAAEAAGIDVFRHKIKAIMLSGAIAAAAGGFYAVILLIVTPHTVFGLLASSQALIVTMFGGIGTVWGPVIGSAFLIPVGELLHAYVGSMLPGIQGVVYGAAIIAVILLAPEGVYWRLRDWLAGSKEPGVTERQGTSAGAVVERVSRPAGKVVLQVSDISKSFGGLKAVQNASFEVREGEILGLIGPNGAGKTTLFNLLNGFYRPNSGNVLLFGKDITGLRPHEACNAGMGRTFQIARPFPRLSVFENVIVGAIAVTGSTAEAREQTVKALEVTGLSEVADLLPSSLTSKELRLLEIARAIAGKPGILLLDETLAGLGKQEVDEVMSVINRIANSGVTIVIIEHTMHAMVRLADRFIVLDHGEIIAEGVPHEVVRQPKVVEAYLGKKWVENA